MTTTEPQAGDRYLIRKRGMYYRPNAEGYTCEKAHAGRFTLEQAISHSHPNGPDGPRDGIDYVLADEPAAPCLASVSSASAEPRALDWRLIAKAAGEHGVRYRTNTAMAKFLAAIASPEPVPATNQAGEVAKYADMDIDDRATAMADDCVGDPWEMLGFFREKLRQSEANAESAKAAAIRLAQRLAALATQPATSPSDRQMQRVTTCVYQYRNAPFRSADWLAGELMKICETAPDNDTATQPATSQEGESNKSFTSWPNDTLADQCRMQARDQLDPEFSSFLAEVANRITATPTRTETREAELRAEIERLRGLLIDPGDPAWEDARAVLVAELRKNGIETHADNIAVSHAVPIPSWIALNLIAHARLAPTPPTLSEDLREAFERLIQSADDAGTSANIGTMDEAIANARAALARAQGQAS